MGKWLDQGDQGDEAGNASTRTCHCLHFDWLVFASMSMDAGGNVVKHHRVTIWPVTGQCFFPYL